MNVHMWKKALSYTTLHIMTDTHYLEHIHGSTCGSIVCTAYVLDLTSWARAEHQLQSFLPRVCWYEPHIEPSTAELRNSLDLIDTSATVSEWKIEAHVRYIKYVHNTSKSWIITRTYMYLYISIDVCLNWRKCCRAQSICERRWCVCIVRTTYYIMEV